MLRTTFDQEFKRGILLGFWAVVGVACVASAQAQAARKGKADEQTLDHEQSAVQRLQDPNGLTPRQVTARALKFAPQVRLQEAKRMAAEALRDQSLAMALPVLDLSARYTRISDVEQGGFGAQPDPDAQANYQALLSQVDDPEARQLFEVFRQQSEALTSFEFPILLNQYALNANLRFSISDALLLLFLSVPANEDFMRAQQLQVEAAQADAALGALKAYYQLVRAHLALEVAEASKVQAERQRDRIKVVFQAGAAARPDLLRMEAQVAAADLSVVQARGNVQVAESDLRTRLQLKADEPIALQMEVERFPPLPAQAGDALVQTALTRRKEMEALRLTVRAQDKLVDMRSIDRLPKLELGGNIDYANPNPRVFPQTEEFRTTWDVSVILRWSPNRLLTGGAQMAETEAQLMESRAQLESFSRAVQLQVLSSLAQLRSAQASIEAAKRSVEAAESAYDLRQKQFAAGATTTTEMIDAEVELARARLQYVDAVVGIHQSNANLNHATGKLAVK